MRIRRALPAVAVSSGVALLGAGIALATTGHPAPAAVAAPAANRPAANVTPPLAADPLATGPFAVKATVTLTAAVSAIIAADAGHASVAVEDLSTGATASYNVSDDYVTASIVKLDILCTLLYQDQLSGVSPSKPELALITTMMDNSNNDSAQHLFDDEGGSSAITAANKVFGLSDTTVEVNSLDEAGYSWGDTTTTALDQIRLLRQVFTDSSVLNSANRTYIMGLMAHVESDQRWGVSAAADDPSPSGSDYMLKNGWLPRRITNLWEINSIGEVQYKGRQYLVAVLSNSNKTMDSGISVVQQLAKAAVDSGV